MITEKIVKVQEAISRFKLTAKAVDNTIQIRDERGRLAAVITENGVECKYLGQQALCGSVARKAIKEAIKDECKQKYLDKKRQDPPEMQDIYREMMGNLTNDEFENVMQEQGREYFTAILNGKEIKCWLCAKEFIPDIEGKLYAMGYAWDGERHHNIKVYLD